jgi:DNA transposition AAA+ family ATPase
MENKSKNQVVELIKSETKRLGSQNKVASKCEVSSATISQMINGNWELIKDSLWAQVAKSLGYSPGNWQMADTNNSRMIERVCADAKAHSMFMAISEVAGSGKTSTLKKIAAASASIYLIQAREWSKREFVQNLCTSLGISANGAGYVSTDTLSQRVIQFFREREIAKPLLIIDEADKLKPAALRILIPFYNELEDIAGVVVCGTENLEKEIKKGVQYAKKGYDEIDSRFGRNFIHLFGATYDDVAAVCQANGISETDQMKKIFKEASPSARMHQGKTFYTVGDYRRIKRIIKRELITIKTYEYGN